MECSNNTINNSLEARLSGQFIFEDHTKFKTILAAAEDKKIHSIILDFTHVDFIDSAGLGMLLLLRDLCDKHKKPLVLRHPQGQVKKVFGISKFEHLFTVEA